MNYDSIYCLPGIGQKSGDILVNAGFDKVEKIYDIFKRFHFDPKQCQNWLRSNCGSYSHNALRCYEALKKHYDEHEERQHKSASKNQQNKELAPTQTAPLVQDSNSNLSAAVLVDSSTDKKSVKNRTETVKIYCTPHEDLQNITPSMNQVNNESEQGQTVSPQLHPKSNSSVATPLDMGTDKKSDEHRTNTVEIYYTPDAIEQNKSVSKNQLNNQTALRHTVSLLQNPNSNSSAIRLNTSTDKESNKDRSETVKIYSDEDIQNVSFSTNQLNNHSELGQTVSPLTNPNSYSSGARLNISIDKKSDKSRTKTIKKYHTSEENKQYKSRSKNQKNNQSESPQSFSPLQSSDSNSSVEQFHLSNAKRSVENSIKTVDLNYNLHEDRKNKSLLETCYPNKQYQTPTTVQLLQSRLKSSTKESPVITNGSSDISNVEIMQNMYKLKEKLDAMAAQICYLEREKMTLKDHIRMLEGELNKVKVLQKQQEEKIDNVTEKNDKRAKTFNYVINEQIELRKQERLSTQEELNKLRADILKLNTKTRKPPE